MEDIRITIPAVPVPMPRPRAASRGPHLPPTLVSNVEGSSATTFKATARMAAQAAYAGPPIDEPIALTAIFVFPRPKGLRRKKDPPGRIPHWKRPDVDNLAKCLLDALTGVVWTDDNRIHECRLVKVYAALDEQPHVEAVIWQTPGDIPVEPNRRSSEKRKEVDTEQAELPF